MKSLLLFAALALTLSCGPVFADDSTNIIDQANIVIMKVNADLSSGKRTEADLSDDLKQFDVLLAQHKGEKNDTLARVLYMKSVLYSQVIGNPAKADAVIKQLTNDFTGTKFVDDMMAEQAQEAASKQIQDSLAIGKKFPDFKEKDVMGKPLSIANDKGKVVLIDFWATWCGPCRGEIPNVVATYQKYHGKGFEIIGVSLDSDQQALLNFIKQNNMTWPQYFDGLQWQNKLSTKYGIDSIPMTYLVDGKGKIIGKDLRGEELTDMVANALAK